MAQYPCSFCGKRYAGPQQTAYPALMNGQSVLSRKMRCCPDDFARLVNAPWLHLVPEGDPEQRQVCSSCGDELVTARVFVPYYEAHQERCDLFGQVCAACAPMARDALFGPQEPQERALTA